MAQYFREDPFFRDTAITGVPSPFGQLGAHGFVGGQQGQLVRRDPFGPMFPFGSDRSMGLMWPFGGMSPFMGMPSMFNNMGAMMVQAPNNPNAHTYSSSTVMHFSSMGGQGGQPRVYHATSSTRQAPGGIKETRKSVKDSETGVQKMSIGHHIGDRSHTIERHYNARTSEKEEHQEFVNLDETDAGSFSQEWRQRTHATAGQRNHRALTLPRAANQPSTSEVPHPPHDSGRRHAHAHVHVPSDVPHPQHSSGQRHAHAHIYVPSEVPHPQHGSGQRHAHVHVHVPSEVPHPPPSDRQRHAHTHGHVHSPTPGKRKQRPVSLSGEPEDDPENPQAIPHRPAHQHHHDNQHHKHARIQRSVSPQSTSHAHPHMSVPRHLPPIHTPSISQPFISGVPDSALPSGHRSRSHLTGNEQIYRPQGNLARERNIHGSVSQGQLSGVGWPKKDSKVRFQ